MKPKEVSDLKRMHPFLSTVLRMISQGQVIYEGDPLWPTYLIARQRGFFIRIGDEGKLINVSPRGSEFLNMAKK